jgi:hypothetical protein
VVGFLRGRFAALVLLACGSRTELDTPLPRTSGHAVSFADFGDDVFLSGLNATPASGFTWDFWFQAAKLPTSSAIDLHAGATMMVGADDQGCEDVYVGFGSEFTPANRLAFNLDGPAGCSDRDTSPIDFAPPEGFVANRWYFVAASHDYATGQSRLYLDGVLVASKIAPIAPIPRALPITIGRWWDRIDTQYAYNQFVGAIDELHVFARALSDAEIASEHACARVDDAIAGYHFDEGSGASAADFEGGHQASLEHDATWMPGGECGD